MTSDTLNTPKPAFDKAALLAKYVAERDKRLRAAAELLGCAYLTTSDH